MKATLKLSFFSAMALAVQLLSSPLSRAQSSPGSIVDIAAGNPDFSTLVTAAQAAGLVGTLSGPGPFTVFAPNNAAFAKLPAGTIESLLQDTNRLRQILLYHVVAGRVLSTNLQAGRVATAQGAAVTVNLTSGVKINDSTVIAADIEASNGVIHVIDTVLLPPGNIVEIAAGNPDFSTLVAAAQAAGLVDTLSGLGPFTILAPNNAAFAKLPAGTVEGLLQDTNRLRQILLYHVVPGRVRSTDLQSGKVITAQGSSVSVDLTNGVKFNNSTVLAADIEASNGVIHVIDTVLLPPGNIVEIAAGNPDFSTLVTAAQAAGLVNTLSGSGPFTILAPNNAAFAKLPAGTVEGLLQDTNRLRKILLYHIVRGRVRSTDLQSGKVITLQGAAATVSLTNGVKINDSTVIASDIEASNGVVHVIDTVLLPPPSIVEIASGNPDFSTLVTAVQAAGLVDALSADGPYSVFAPNNAAFAKLPAGTIEALLQDTNRLRHVLLYHVNHGPRLRATNLQNGLISTMHGGSAKIAIRNSAVAINQANVIAADIEALNGIIHVIDEVILPDGGFENFSVSASVKGNQITLVWPVSNGQIQVLEGTPSLAPPTWSAIDATVITSDGVSKVVLPGSAQSQFFRIRSTSP